MALTTEQKVEIETYLALVNGLVNILQQQVYIDPTVREASGLSDENIESLNDTIDQALQAVDTVLAEAMTP